MYAILHGEKDGIWGFTSMANNDANLPRIANGRVEIPMWVFYNDQASRWFGNATFYIFVGISSVSVFDGSGANFVSGRFFEAVPFVNGSATRTWAQGYEQD